MSEDSNKKDKKLDLNKVEEPTIAYNLEKTYANIEDHPLFAKVIEKGMRESELGLGISHEEMKRITKLRYPFLK